MRRSFASRAQRALVFLAVGLVASFFVFGMVVPRQAATPPAENPSVEPSALPTPTRSPSTTPRPAPGPDDPHPGVPLVPVAQHPVWPETKVRNPDRQLGVKATDPLEGTAKAPSSDLTGYWEQQVVWQPCRTSALCTTIQVPLDWEDPGRAALSIAMIKLPAASPTGEPIFVNPGGPGVAGLGMAETVGTDRWPGHDVIAWDPRGTGDSTHISCGTDQQTDVLRALDTTPDDDAEKQALIDGWAGFARLCRDEAGDLLDHVTTIEVTRDMDLMRYLVGAKKLNFFGVSYGTYLGAMYAELFPDRAGRLLLDSAVDITNDENAPSQAEGFELALDNYAKWCAGQTTCRLGGTESEVLGTVDGFLSGLDADPVRVGDRKLTQSLGLVGILMFLYADESAYKYLTFAINEAMQGRGEVLLEAADELDGRGTHFASFPAMSCADWPDDGVDAAFKELEKIRAKAPIVGKHMGVQPVCETWTANSAPQLRITGQGAPPIVVVGTTGDSATPYQHAVTMAEQLVSGALVTFEGAGHGSVLGNNACLAKAARDFMVDGVVPADGTRCR